MFGIDDALLGFGISTGANALGSLFGGQKKQQFNLAEWLRLMNEQAGTQINKQFSPYRALASQMGRKEPQVGAQALAKVSAEQRGTLSDAFANIARQGGLMKLQYEAGQPAEPNLMSRISGAVGGIGQGLQGYLGYKQQQDEDTMYQAMYDWLMKKRGQSPALGVAGVSSPYLSADSSWQNIYSG